MAAPTAPTQATLLREALDQANSIEKYARARDEWFPQILRDMASRRDWKVLEASAVVLLTENKPAVNLPSDYSRWLQFVLYWGTDGLAQAGAVGSMTLAADESASVEDVEGRYCIIVGGTGSGQHRTSTVYDTSTKIATPDENWTTAPAASSQYVIGTQWRRMDITFLENQELGSKPGVPDSWTEYNGQIVWNRPPDETVVAGILKYYMDIDKMDLTSADMTEIYARWRNPILHKLKYFCWMEKGDARAMGEDAAYERDVLTAARLDERQRRGRRTFKFRSIGGMPVQGY